MEILKRLAGLISAEPGRPHPLDGGDSGLPAPGATPSLPTPNPVHPRVLAIVHNPIIPMKGGQKAQHAYGWNDPDVLAQGYIDDIAAISDGYAQFRIVERIEADEFPLKKDGYRYTPADFHRAWTTRQPHNPDDVDYLALVRQFKLIERINDDQIDEVWLLGFPYCGYYESIMAGPGAFWCNAPPLIRASQKALYHHGIQLRARSWGNAGRFGPPCRVNSVQSVCQHARRGEFVGAVHPL